MFAIVAVSVAFALCVIVGMFPYQWHTHTSPIAYRPTQLQRSASYFQQDTPEQAVRNDAAMYLYLSGSDL